MNSKPTGYPSIDKPWLRYYSEEAVSAELPRDTMYGYLWECNSDHLDSPALDYFGRRISFAELFERIDATASAFWQMGIRAGDVVVICSVTTPETIYALYALNHLGAISNMVDPRTSAEGIHEYINETAAKLVVAIDVALPKIREAIVGTTATRVIVTSPSDSLPIPLKIGYKVSSLVKHDVPQLFDGCIRWRDFIAYDADLRPSYPGYVPNTCAVIVHTGGTTGTPKGVMLSNDNLNAAAFQCIAAGFDFQRNQSWLNIMPPFIAYGVGNGLHLPLIVGMRTILIPTFDPNKFDELLIKHRPNHMVGVPSHYGNIIESSKMTRENLSYIIAPTVGGDAMDVDLERRVNEFLAEHGCDYLVTKGYGMTEVCAAVSVCTSNETNRLGSVGIPLTHTTISIFDQETGEELPFGELGEVCSIGPNTMLGYWDNAEATHEVIREHSDGQVWVHSGDLGYMDEDGFLYIVDRIKRMIVRHDGFKVFPSMIEKVLSSHSSVEACCVVGTPDSDHAQGKLPVAFIATRSGEDTYALRKNLSDLCKRNLPEYALPATYVFIDALPLTPIGKVDYRELEWKAAKFVGADE